MVDLSLLLKIIVVTQEAGILLTGTITCIILITHIIRIQYTRVDIITIHIQAITGPPVFTAAKAHAIILIIFLF